MSLSVGSGLARQVAHMLACLEDPMAVPPVQLAELFALTGGPSASSKALLHALQRHLLMLTLRHATAHTEFYRRRAYQFFPDSSEAETPPDLSLWPIIRRHHVIEHFDEFIAGDVDFQSDIHTSGSTGPSLTIYKSAQELAFLWKYYERVLAPLAELSPVRPLTLFFPNLYHGVGVRLPSFGRVFVSGVTDDTLIQDALKVLLKTYKLDGCETRISVISGLSFHVRFFTSFLIDSGYDPRQFGIRSLNVVGEFIPRSVRDGLTNAWDAAILERFTLTESVGGAYRCLRCDHFHLDSHVVGEVVAGDSPIETGVGELILTQLYPFVQMQPLVRYATGDLVRRVSSTCANTLTFDFLGKINNCVGWSPGGEHEWLIYSADLHECISELPDVRLYDAFPNVRLVRDTSVVGLPIFTLSATETATGQLVIHLTLELRYAPHAFSKRVSEIDRIIRKALTPPSSAMVRRLAEGSVKLDINYAGPGTLGDAMRIKV